MSAPTPDFAYRVHLYDIAARRPRADYDRRPFPYGYPQDIVRALGPLSPTDRANILAACAAEVSL